MTKRTVRVDEDALIEFLPFEDALQDGDIRIVNRGPINFIARIEHWTGTRQTGAYAVSVKAKAGTDTPVAGLQLAWERGAYIYRNNSPGTGRNITDLANKLANRISRTAEESLYGALTSRIVNDTVTACTRNIRGGKDTRGVETGVRKDATREVARTWGDDLSADVGAAIEKSVRELRA